MGLDLHVSVKSWRSHLDTVAGERPGLVPVIKGNGYGFGFDPLATECSRLNVELLAVGITQEAEQFLSDPRLVDSYRGDILILSPWRPHHTSLVNSRLIHTLSRVDDIAPFVAAVPQGRFLLELETSMHRHGIDIAALDSIDWSGLGDSCQGFTIHLPLAGNQFAEARAIAGTLAAHHLSQPLLNTLFVSHLTASEEEQLRSEFPSLQIRSRIGTEMWLGNREALRARVSVEDLHFFERSGELGYRQNRVSAGSTVLVLAGGTAHGIGLEAPPTLTDIRSRVGAIGRGTLAAAGRNRSPFFLNEKQLWFVEPPHMQASMVLLPSGATAPAVGSLVDARVRFTATEFDRVIFESDSNV